MATMSYQTKAEARQVLNQQNDEPIRYCLYARKSTEEEERQVMSIDSQIKEIGEMAIRENLNVIEIKRESHSAKESGTRPVFKELLEDIRSRKFSGILTWAPDRLSRNGGDLGMIVDLMDQGLLREIRSHSQKFTNNPNEKFLLMILGSQAKLENDHRSINVSRGLRAKCERGQRPCNTPIGYLTVRSPKHGEPSKVIPDPERAPIVVEMFKRVAEVGASGRDIKAWLDQCGFRTRGGAKISLSVIYKILREPFYAGTFEYPVGSGTWYKGAYEPIISQKLFDQAREIIKDRLTPKSKPGTNQFDFTRMMTCGTCGSGIGAMEKIRTIKTTGEEKRYVYYYCHKFKDPNCKELYVREEEILNQLEVLIDTIDLNELKAKKQLMGELERFKQFTTKVLGSGADLALPKGLDLRSYAKYLLREGSRTEKRELLSCLKSTLRLKDKKLIIN